MKENNKIIRLKDGPAPCRASVDKAKTVALYIAKRLGANSEQAKAAVCAAARGAKGEKPMQKSCYCAQRPTVRV
ncbi:hypothetical protein [Microbulbifer epialgicus]|uniref:Uncharacterized protein n=1 Tax=Microbulbifer epialgicus TaxID=393907 RepID=A0ABV4P6B5_9GAMM